MQPTSQHSEISWLRQGLIFGQRLLPAFVGGVIGGAVGREERNYRV